MSKKQKNEEIADLVHKQVSEAPIDPFSASFQALWGTSSLSPISIKSSLNLNMDGNMPEEIETGINLDMDKSILEEIKTDINLDTDTLGKVDTEIDNFQQPDLSERFRIQKNTNVHKTMVKFGHVQNKTGMDFNIEGNNILTVIQNVSNFAVLGFITFLNVLYPEGHGTFSINGLSKISGMSRPSIRGNLQQLEKLRLATFTESTITLSEDCKGWININMYKYDQHPKIINSNLDMDENIPVKIHTSSEKLESTDFSRENMNLDMYENIQAKNSSSSFIQKETTTTTTTTTTNTDNSINLNVDKKIQLLPWERAQLESIIEELFYIALTIPLEPTKLSRQTFEIYQKIRKERGCEYAIGLFLLLFPKAKDNPTGYIASALSKGATPSYADINRAKEILASINCLGNVRLLDEQSLKKKLQAAVDIDDTEQISELIKLKSSIKFALETLRWKKSIDELVEEKQAFIRFILTFF
jgi:hypothetical protein